MKKFSFISFILFASFLYAPSWAMEVEEGVKLRVRGGSIQTPIKVTEEEAEILVQDFHQRRGAVQFPLNPHNTKNELDLTKKSSPRAWDPGLKQTLAVKLYRRTLPEFGKDTLHIITGVVSPSKAPDLVFFYNFSTLNLTQVNLSTEAITRKFEHVAKNAPYIRILNLSHNNINDRWIWRSFLSDDFKKLPLRELNLSHNEIDESSYHLLRILHGLWKCNLSYNEVSRHTVKTLQKLFSSSLAPKTLSRLFLQNNPGTIYNQNKGVEIINLRRLDYTLSNPLQKLPSIYQIQILLQLLDPLKAACCKP